VAADAATFVLVAALIANGASGSGRAAAADAPPLPRATPESVGLSPVKLGEAKALLNQYVGSHRIAGGVAAVARRGKLAWLETVGLQDVASARPMTDRSIFRIYSMTKSMTAVGAMMLHEEGRFQLDDPVSKYLPRFADAVVRAGEAATRSPARAVTVRDLLLHTSGLEHRTSEVYRRARVRSRDITLTQFIDNLVRVPLMEDPGTRYRYSEGTSVVGRLIEVWSGKPLDVFLADRVFKPLGMTDTAFWADANQRARLATVYGPTPDGGLAPIELEEVPFTAKPTLLEGAVGLLSTVPDYLRFCQMLLNGGELDGVRVLRRDTVAAMTRNSLPEPVLVGRGGQMGWGLANVNVALPTGEYGWDGTAGTIFWIDPGRDMVTILMTQAAPANPDRLRQRFKTLIDEAVIP
jgi:CubicO group peptidase (beta-lactamase class C family)